LKSSKFEIIILVAIVFLGLFLRVYKLDSVPPGLTWDEAALGYNAYSISQTLKDEYGNFLPLTLKSFGDYKPALYAYLIIPFMLVLGLNEIAVRLPSVFAGVGLIILSYLFTKQIFRNSWLGITVAFFTAISPLSIMFSRAGWESNVALFLNVAGLYLFIKGLNKPKYFIFSAVLFSLSLICYQASKIFIPITLFGLFIFYRKEINYNKTFFSALGLIVGSLSLVFISTFLLGQSNRLAAQNYFAYARPQERIEKISQEENNPISSFEFQYLHGEWWSFLSGIFERYLIYFSPKTLFIDGDYSPRHNVPEMGVLSLYGLVLIPLGFYLLWRREEKDKKIIFFWLFTATIPAVLSRDLISMVRALNLVFPLVVLQGFGCYFLVKKLITLLHVKKMIVIVLSLFVVTLNFCLFLDAYFVHLPKENATGWLYGYKQVIEQLPQDLSKYQNVVFTDKYGQPYIYYLFYSKYPPEKFQKQAVLEQKTVDVGTVRRIDNIEFRQVNWPSDRGAENTLFIGGAMEIPDKDIVTEEKSTKLGTIDFPDGKTAFNVVENGYEKQK
jgi:4-amino-4-deoxy-L-arabinose transferase-like glycosyltransferase